MRDAVGWWVLQRELTPKHASTVDTTRIGPKWATHKPRWWHEVYARTGARTTGGEAVAASAEDEPNKARQPTVRI